MDVYHCADPRSRAFIEAHGLRGARFEKKIFAWPTLEAAHAYRFKMNESGWADIWAFDDRGRSIDSVLMSADSPARMIEEDIPADRLALIYSAPF